MTAQKDRVLALAEQIVAREGGYVNDPDDPGGPTRYGVTLETMRRHGLDLDGDGEIDAQDVRQIGKARAADLFATHYFYRPRLDALPEVLWPQIFDMYVNSGANAVRILQRLLGDMGHKLAVDGIVGPQTIAAARAAHAAAPDHLADAYGIARREFYYALAAGRPSSRKYATTRAGAKGGWIRRAEAFIAPRFRLSDAEHRARVASWG